MKVICYTMPCTQNKHVLTCKSTLKQEQHQFSNWLSFGRYKLMGA